MSIEIQIDQYLAEQEENDRAWERLQDQVENEYSYAQLEEIAEAIRWKRDKPTTADGLLEALIEHRWTSGQ